MRRVLGLTIPILLLSCLGCSNGGGANGGGGASFAQKVSGMPVGTPKAVVQRQLGRPDVKRLAVAGARPAGDASDAMNAGSRYEKWTYVRQDMQYDVILGPSQGRRGQWEVQDVKTSTATASAW